MLWEKKDGISSHNLSLKYPQTQPLCVPLPGTGEMRPGKQHLPAWYMQALLHQFLAVHITEHLDELSVECPKICE